MKPEIEKVAEEAQTAIRKVMDALGIKATMDVEREDEFLTIIFDGWINLVISWGDTTQPSILPQKTEGPVYEITISVPVYNYPSEPDDVDEVDQGKFTGLYDAVSEVLTIYHNNVVSQVLQGIEESKHFDEELDM